MAPHLQSLSPFAGDEAPTALSEHEYPLGSAQLDRLLSAVYIGITETTPWKTALELLRDLINARHATLMLRPPSTDSTGVMINAGDVDERATESYETHFFAVDPFIKIPNGHVASAEEIVGEKDWLASDMYQQYLKPLDIRHMLGTEIHTDDGIECRLRMTRPPDTEPFSEHDKNVVRIMLPHLRRAIQLHAQLDYLECERQVYSGAMNRMLLGMVSFAGDRSIMEVNEEAARILAEKDGIWRTGTGLKAANRGENQELQRLIREAIDGGVSDSGTPLTEATSITRQFDRGRLGIVVRSIPIGPWTESTQRPAAALFMRDPDYNSPEPSEDVVRRVFGLTRMEAALAVLLAKGQSLDDAAESLGVRRNTARTHLRSIFGKTGVSRQTMLVRMILKSVVSLG